LLYTFLKEDDISKAICVRVRVSVRVSGDFCNFSIKIKHFYACFGKNSYFKAITQQLKAFEL